MTGWEQAQPPPLRIAPLGWPRVLWRGTLVGALTFGGLIVLLLVRLVDWRLCGLLSDLARRGRLSGGAGEFTLVGCDERLACEGLLLRGLGARADFAADVFRRAVADVFARSFLFVVEDIPKVFGSVFESQR